MVDEAHSGSNKQAQGASFEGLKTLGRSLLTILQTRLELVGLEIADERARLSDLFVHLAVTFAAVFLACLFLAACAIAAAWESPYRLAILAVITLALVAVAAIAFAATAKKINGHGRMFAASVDQLKIDIASLK